ncbi:MAG: HEPN domain-containing protein [Fibromonadaceae bacterium]|jgi:HEPN domain-containing protein|nr:HEPN domain-containing protein [Fibromonadaceae bacterium]
MDSYKEWLKRARSSLELAKTSSNELVYYEDLCFQAQQAVEKGMKGLLMYYSIEPEKTHNLSVLLQELEKHTEINDEIKEVLKLQNFAVQTRYPGQYEQVKKEEYEKSLAIAEKCLEWIEEKAASVRS